VKFVDEFRDPALGRAVAGEILSLVEPGRHYKVMEVCGGHTHSIYKYGVDDLLPSNVELVHGPGCPVCVIPMGRVDDGIALAHEDVIFTCFGDMMRVPGSRGTLLEAKAEGADVRMVYSPLDALELARRNPEREVVFFAIGFETTAPATALTLLRARAEGVSNFSAFCNHVTIGPPLRAREVAKERITPVEGLPALSLDALTSVAYGPEAIIVVLAVAGGIIAGIFGGWRAARLRPAAALAKVG